MVALNASVRKELLNLINIEIAMVNAKAQAVAERYWQKAEKAICVDLGYGDALARIEHLKNEISALQKELTEIEDSVKERAQSAGIEDYSEVDIAVEANQYGRVVKRPVIFGRAIATVWDIKVLKYLNQTVPFLQIYNTMSQLHHVFKRELYLCGNHEDARLLYQRFHQKITDAVGVELPGVLSDIPDLPKLEQG